MRVLSNPRQRRFFKTNDIHDLFMLNDESSSEPLARLKSLSKSASKNSSRARSAQLGATNLVERSALPKESEKMPSKPANPSSRESASIPSKASSIPSPNSSFGSSSTANPLAECSSVEACRGGDEKLGALEDGGEGVAGPSSDEKRSRWLRKLARRLSRRLGRQQGRADGEGGRRAPGGEGVEDAGAHSTSTTTTERPVAGVLVDGERIRAAVRLERYRTSAEHNTRNSSDAPAHTTNTACPTSTRVNASSIAASSQNSCSSSVDALANKERSHMDDEYVMRQLLGRHTLDARTDSSAGDVHASVRVLHSVLEHDALLAGGDLSADRCILAKEANAVAAVAVQSLQRSSRLCPPSHSGSFHIFQISDSTSPVHLWASYYSTMIFLSLFNPK